MFKSLKIYLYIFYYDFLGLIVYPYELIITVVQPLIEVGLMALFWSMFAKNSPTPISLVGLIAYFVMVQFVAIWAMNPEGLNFASFISWKIKNGTLTQNLIRPIRPLPSILFEQRGYYCVDMIFSVVLFAIAIKMIGNIAPAQFIWFIIFLFLAFIITFSFSTLIASIAFSTKEISGIKNSISHLVRVLSGTLVPLTFFPDKIKSVIVYTPFPSMVFAPINVLQNKLASETILFDFKISLFWAVALFTISILVWRFNLKKYEAIGI